MAPITRIGEMRRVSGFTLIELLVVLTLIALLAGIVTPIVTGSVQRARESALRQDLYVLRKAIDDYYADKGRYPASLEELVEKRYIRNLPKDPLTESSETWQLVRTESEGADAGIIDVHSGSGARSKQDGPYSEW